MHNNIFSPKNWKIIPLGEAILYHPLFLINQVNYNLAKSATLKNNSVATQLNINRKFERFLWGFTPPNQSVYYGNPS